MDDDTMSISTLAKSLYNCCPNLSTVGLSKHADVADWNVVAESDVERVMATLLRLSGSNNSESLVKLLIMIVKQVKLLLKTNIKLLLAQKQDNKDNKDSKHHKNKLRTQLNKQKDNILLPFVYKETLVFALRLSQYLIWDNISVISPCPNIETLNGAACAVHILGTLYSADLDQLKKNLHTYFDLSRSSLTHPLISIKEIAKLVFWTRALQWFHASPYCAKVHPQLNYDLTANQPDDVLKFSLYVAMGHRIISRYGTDASSIPGFRAFYSLMVDSFRCLQSLSRNSRYSRCSTHSFNCPPTMISVEFLCVPVPATVDVEPKMYPFILWLHREIAANEFMGFSNCKLVRLTLSMIQHKQIFVQIILSSLYHVFNICSSFGFKEIVDTLKQRMKSFFLLHGLYRLYINKDLTKKIDHPTPTTLDAIYLLYRRWSRWRLYSLQNYKKKMEFVNSCIHEYRLREWIMEALPQVTTLRDADLRLFQNREDCDKTLLYLSSYSKVDFDTTGIGIEECTFDSNIVKIVLHNSKTQYMLFQQTQSDCEYIMLMGNNLSCEMEGSSLDLQFIKSDKKKYSIEELCQILKCAHYNSLLLSEDEKQAFVVEIPVEPELIDGLLARAVETLVEDFVHKIVKQAIQIYGHGDSDARKMWFDELGRYNEATAYLTINESETYSTSWFGCPESKLL